MCNGYVDTGSARNSPERVPPTPPPTPPLHHDHHHRRPIDELDFIEPAPIQMPIVPKRTRSQSRATSVAMEDDRTSHGAESLPGDYDIPPLPRDSSSREPSLPGYAVIEKKDKPPRPPPPRRKKQDKFATAPRPSKSQSKRPQTMHTTLRTAKSDTIRYYR